MRRTKIAVSAEATVGVTLVTRTLKHALYEQPNHEHRTPNPEPNLNTN
jgi:hypothetical protein